MDYTLPFKIEVKAPVSRTKIIIFAAFILFVDMFLFALLSLFSLTSVVGWWYYFCLLVPVGLFFLGLIFLYSNTGTFLLDEKALTYSDFFEKRVSAYSDILSIGGKNISTSTGVPPNMVAGATFFISISLKNGKPIMFNPLVLGRSAMETMIKIIRDKNPGVKVDEYAVALETGDVKPIERMMDRNILLTLIFGLLILSIEFFSENGFFGSRSSSAVITGLIFLVIIVVLFIYNRMRKHR